MKYATLLLSMGGLLCPYLAAFMVLFSQRSWENAHMFWEKNTSLRFLWRAFRRCATLSTVPLGCFAVFFGARLILDSSCGTLPYFPWYNFVLSTVHVWLHFLPIFFLAFYLWSIKGSPWFRWALILACWLLLYHIESLVAEGSSPAQYLLFPLYPLFSAGIRSFYLQPGTLTHLSARPDVFLLLFAGLLGIVAYARAMTIVRAHGRVTD